MVELPSKVCDTPVVHSQRIPFITCTHIGVTVVRKLELISTHSCAAKNRNRSVQTMCRFHCQELHPTVHDTLVAHSKIRVLNSSKHAEVSVAWIAGLSARPRWPSQSQSKFTDQVSTSWPGAHHKTNGHLRAHRRLALLIKYTPGGRIGAQSHRGCTTQASASPPRASHKLRRSARLQNMCQL